MTNNNERLEKYLAEFQPLPIRKLKLPPQTVTTWPHRLAAAAVLVLTSGLGLWFAYRHQTPPAQIIAVQPRDFASTAPDKKLGALALTRLALENDREFQLYLLRQSRTVLPSLQGEHSTLRILVTE